MMITKTRLFKVTTFLLLMLFTYSLSAQSKVFDDIRSVKLRDMGTIMNGNDVSGYFVFYEVDKVDRKNRKFLLQILDENLETVAKKTIVKSKHVELADAAFNNQHIMLKFFDPKEKTYSFKSYDLKGEKGRSAVRELKKKEYNKPLFMRGEGVISHGNAFFAVPDQGFVQFASVKNKKWGYIIDFIGVDAKSSWKYKSKKDADILQFANYLTANEDMIISNITLAENGFGKGGESAVLAVDVKTGKKIFQKNFGGKKPTQIINGFIDEDREELFIFGLYYDEGAKVSAKAKSRGLFAYTLGYDGKIKTKKYLSWEKDVSKHLKMNKKGKMDGGTYINFHDIIKTADGKILAVGEQYSKNLDGLGVAANILGGGGAPVTKLVIKDMMVFQLNAELDLEDVKVFEKSPSDVRLNIEFVSPQVMAYIAEAYGYFDYSFTQTNEDNSLATFGYVNWEKRKGEKNGFTYGAVSYTDAGYKEDDIRLKREKKVGVRVLPAIPGYVTLVEFDAKEKTINFRMEKINY